MIKQLNY